MASFDPNTLAKTLVQKGGYNSTDAANAARGPRAEELAREFGVIAAPKQSSQSYSSQPVSSQNVYTPANIQNTVNQVRDQINSSIAPLVQSYQAQIDSIPSQTESQLSTVKGQLSAMEQKYQSLIDSIKTTGEQQATRQTVTTRNEIGRRGIPLSSTMAQQEINNAVAPLESNTQNLLSSTAADQQSGLATLTGQINQIQNAGLQQKLALQEALSQLQASTSSSAFNTAMSLLNAQQNAAQYQDELSRTNQLFPLQLQAAQNDLAKSKQAAASSPSLMDLLGLSGGQTSLFTPTEKKPTAPPVLMSVAPKQTTNPYMSVANPYMSVAR